MQSAEGSLMRRRHVAKGVLGLGLMAHWQVRARTISARELDPLKVVRATIHIRLEPEVFQLSDTQLLRWVHRSAEVVSRYYGRFPVP